MKMTGGKTAITRQIKNSIFICLCLLLSVHSSFAQKNKDIITEEFLNKHLEIISQYYDAYNVYGNNNDKALEVLIENLQKNHVDNKTIESIKNDLANYKKDEVQEKLDTEGSINSTDTLIIYNSKLVSELFKNHLNSKFSDFYQNLVQVRNNYMNSSRIINSNFQYFKDKGIIPEKYGKYKEYITYYLSNK